MPTLVEQNTYEQAMSAPFKMPSVEVGTPIAWWASGQKDIGGVSCGMVLRVMPNARMIEAQLLNGNMLFSVRHADDPKLVNPDLREDGCWDFSPFTKHVLERLEMLELEAQTSGKKPKKLE